MWVRAAILTSLPIGVGCQPDPLPDDGGQSGTAIPDGCREVRREPVEELTARPEDFTRSAAEAIAEVEGDWVGEGALAEGGAISARLAVRHDGGPVMAVHLEPTGAEAGEDQAGGGAPEGQEPAERCEPTYAFGVVTDLDASPWVSGAGAGEVARSPGATWFTAETPAEEVSGELAPGFDPADWDRTVLAATLTVAEPAGLELAWWGLSEPAARAATATGTAEPSGVAETIATLAVDRAAAR